MNPDVEKAMQELKDAETAAVNDATAVDVATKKAEASAAVVPIKAKALNDVVAKTYGLK